MLSLHSFRKHKTCQVSRCYYLQLWLSKQHFSSLNWSALPEKGFFTLLSDPDSTEPEPPAAAVASNNLCCEQGPADRSLQRNAKRSTAGMWPERLEPAVAPICGEKKGFLAAITKNFQVSKCH